MFDKSKLEEIRDREKQWLKETKNAKGAEKSFTTESGMLSG